MTIRNTKICNSQDLLITDCFIRSDDDCIAFKGLNLDIIHFTMTAFLFELGEHMKLENITIEDVRIPGEGQRSLIRLKPVVNQ